MTTLPLWENETLIQLGKKIRRNRARILSDEEVDLLASGVRAVLGAAFAELPRGITVRVGDVVRWASLRARCEQARAQQGLSIKEAALALRLPQYRLKAVEAGSPSEIKAEMAWSYFQLLGIERWVKRWARANRELALRMGIILGRSSGS